MNALRGADRAKAFRSCCWIGTVIGPWYAALLPTMDCCEIDRRGDTARCGLAHRTCRLPAAELDSQDWHTPVHTDEGTQRAGCWIAHVGYDAPTVIHRSRGRCERAGERCTIAIEVHERARRSRMEDNDDTGSESLDLRGNSSGFGFAQRGWPARGSPTIVRCGPIPVEIDPSRAGSRAALRVRPNSLLRPVCLPGGGPSKMSSSESLPGVRRSALELRPISW